MNAFETIKEGVPLPEYAAELTELRPSGGVLVGRCPIPDHEDRTPSFTVWPGNDSWWCFGCSRGSDVIDLYFHAEGCSEPWEALVGLSLKYGVELPGRSETWKRRQREKLAIEDLAEDIRFQVRCRRLFKLMILNSPEIQNLESPAEKRQEIRRCWEAFLQGMKRVPRWKRASR